MKHQLPIKLCQTLEMHNIMVTTFIQSSVNKTDSTYDMFSLFKSRNRINKKTITNIQTGTGSTIKALINAFISPPGRVKLSSSL